MQAVRTYDGIKLFRKKAEDPSEKTDDAVGAPEISITGNGSGKWEGWEFTWRILSSEERKALPEVIPEKQYTKWLDCDKIRQNLGLRSRKTGDYLIVNANGGKQKLKDYLINRKIPRELRDHIPVLASGSEIWWVAGERISEAAKVTRETRQILEITASRIG